MGDSTDTPLFVLTTLSPWCHLHAHDCFAKVWHAIRTPFSSLWPLGDTPDTHGPVFSPCSELLRSLARQFHSVVILHRRSSKIVLFLQCFETRTSWEHCIDRIPGVGRKVSSLFNKDKTKNRQNTCRFGSASPNFGSPNCGQMTHSHRQTTKTNTPTRHPWQAPLTFRFHLRLAPSSVRPGGLCM